METSLNGRIRPETSEVDEPARPGRWGRTEWGIFLTVAVILLVNLSLFGPSADPMSRNMGKLTMSIVEARDLNLDEFVHTMVRGEKDLTDKAHYGGHIYSGIPPGVSFLMVPVYLVLKPLMWLIPERPGELNRHQLNFIMLMSVSGALSCIFSAVVATLVYRCSRMMGASRKLGIASALALIPASWYFYYGTHVSAKTLAAGLILFACYNCARALGRLGKTPDRPNTLLFVAGLLAGIAVAVDYAPLWAAIILGTYVLCQGGIRAATWFAAGMIPIGVLTALYHTAAFGGPLVHSYVHRLEASPAPAASWPTLARVYGLLLSPHKGMFFYAPWAVLSLVGCVRGLRTRFKPEVILAGAVVLTTWGFNLLLDVWTGYGWGPRYFTMAVPFLALMLAFVPRKWFALLWTLLVLGTLINLLPVLRGGIVVGEKLWDNPIILYGREILRTGAATYWLRFLSRNVRQLTPAMLTGLQLLLTALTAMVVWFIWRVLGTKESREAVG